MSVLRIVDRDRPNHFGLFKSVIRPEPRVAPKSCRRWKPRLGGMSNFVSVPQFGSLFGVHQLGDYWMVAGARFRRG